MFKSFTQCNSEILDLTQKDLRGAFSQKIQTNVPSQYSMMPTIKQDKKNQK